MNTRNTLTPRIFLCLLAILLPLTAGAHEGPNITPIPKDQFPALVFAASDGHPDWLQRRSRLMVATFPDGKPEVDQIMEAHWFHVTQLSDTVFLLEAGERPNDEEAWESGFFLVDFLTGEHRLVTKFESKANQVDLCCLRSFPDKKEAIVLEYGPGSSRATLLHVDLTTLEATPQVTLPEAAKEQGFDRPSVKVSPDCRRLAALSLNYEVESYPLGKPTTFSLHTLDLESLETCTLDTNIVQQFGSSSPLSPDMGLPPFEWIDSQRIVYLHTPPRNLEPPQRCCDGERVWKCVHADTGQVEEWTRETGPLANGPMSLEFDWFREEYRY